jgi:hypothetical protein
MQYRTTHELSAQDAIIFAAIVSHLAARPSDGPHYFVSQNTKDFGTAPIAEELSRFDCTFVADFNTIIVGYLRDGRRTIE